MSEKERDRERERNREREREDEDRRQKSMQTLGKVRKQIDFINSKTVKAKGGKTLDEDKT